MTAKKKHWKYVFSVEAIEQSDERILLTLYKLNRAWFPAEKDDVMEFDEEDLLRRLP